MAPIDCFKVAIVGGGIAGLALANLLDKLGIDFFVLEAYDKIAPQIGASIGWHPNGLRILDHLGCYEEMLAAAAPAVAMTARTADGKLLYSHRIAEQVKERHGYEIAFMERRVALDILFKHLNSKHKVHTGQRLTRVEFIGDKVRLYTHQGNVFDADIAVGADGIHSTVRQEMIRLARDISPETATNANKMVTEYGCVFGISSQTGSLTTSEVHLVHKNDVTIACMVGPEDKPYWFLFFKLADRIVGDRLPKFTKADEIALTSQEADTLVTPDVSFQELYDNLLFSTTTPLPHHVFDPWHVGRAMLIGDSIHKFNPISGQGGNSALESASALADNLALALGQSGGRLSNAQIKAVFSKTESVRRPRVAELVQASIEAQRISAWATPLSKFVDCYVAPLIDTPMFVDAISRGVVGGYGLQSLVPQRREKHDRKPLIPFVSQHADSSSFRLLHPLLTLALYMALLSFSVKGLATWPQRYGAVAALEDVIKHQKYPEHDQKMFSFAGVPFLGGPMAFLVAIYFPATEFWDKAFFMLTWYLSISELVVFAVFAVESCRVRNRIKPSRLAVLIGSISNVTAIAFGSCIYFFLDNISNLSDSSWWTTATHAPPNKARAVLPAVLLGMLVPTLFMFCIWLPSYPRQGLTICWMFSPIYLYLLQKTFSRASPQNGSSSGLTISSRRRSAAYIKRLYTVVGLATGAVHVTTIAIGTLTSNPALSITRIFGPGYHDKMSVYEGSHKMFVWDLYITMGALLAWSFSDFVSMARSLDLDYSSLAVLAALLTGSIFVGPAAATAFYCVWREDCMIQGLGKDKLS